MSNDVTRRGFLKGVGIVLAGTYYGLRIDPGFAAAIEPVLSGYPRVFAFRQAETLAILRSYSDRAKTFHPFDGMIARLLQEERTDTASNLDYFTRFKTANPKNSQSCTSMATRDCPRLKPMAGLPVGGSIGREP